MNNFKTDFQIDYDVDLKNTLDSGQSFAWNRVDETDEIAYRGYFRDTELLVIESKGRILVKILNGKFEDDIEGKFMNYLGVNPYTITNFETLLNDEIIFPVIKKYPKLRLLRQEPWECMIGFITSSCSNLQRIKYHMSLLRSLNNYIFPSPEKMYDLGENKLRTLGFGFRAPYIINLSKAILSEKISLVDLYNSPYKKSLESLIQIKGIGRKIADCILAYSFDKTESFPVDRHVLNGLIRWYKFPKKITPEKASDLANERFGLLSSYAQQYIFHRQRLASRATKWGGTHIKYAISSDID